MDGELGSVTPDPDHPAKEYPVSGVAEMDAREPYEKLPSPETCPPEPARRWSVYWLMEKVAETDRS